METQVLLTRLEDTRALGALLGVRHALALPRDEEGVVVVCEGLLIEAARAVDPLVSDSSWVGIQHSTEEKWLTNALQLIARFGPRRVTLNLVTQWARLGLGVWQSATGDERDWDLRLERERSTESSAKVFQATANGIKNLLEHATNRMDSESAGGSVPSSSKGIARWELSRNSLLATFQTQSLHGIELLPSALNVGQSDRLHAHIEVASPLPTVEAILGASEGGLAVDLLQPRFALRPDYTPGFRSAPLSSLRLLIDRVGHFGGVGAMVSLWGLVWKDGGAGGTVADALDLVRQEQSWSLRLRTSEDIDSSQLRLAVQDAMKSW